MQGDFVTDISEIRRRARQHIEAGPVTPSYSANREVVLNLLNEALATELVCVMRYKRHYYMARGISSESVADLFLEHAHEEQEHADRLSERIAQLGGAPNYNPEGLLTRSASEYVEGDSLNDMIKEDLVAERIAIDTYKEMISYVGAADPTTRRLLEEVLEEEEEHANELADLITRVSGDGKQKKAS